MPPLHHLWKIYLFVCLRSYFLFSLFVCACLGVLKKMLIPLSFLRFHNIYLFILKHNTYRIFQCANMCPWSTYMSVWILENLHVSISSEVCAHNVFLTLALCLLHPHAYTYTDSTDTYTYRSHICTYVQQFVCVLLVHWSIICTFICIYMYICTYTHRYK